MSGSLSRVDLPTTPPFVLRGRLLTPLDTGGTRYERDALVEVDGAGRIGFVGGAAERPDVADRALDLRPWVLMPGMVDLHAHLPQLPNAGLGAGMELLAWLERYIFPLERAFDVPAAERIAPAAWRAFAAAGTTTAMVYGAVYEASLDATFRAAEAHGIDAGWEVLHGDPAKAIPEFVRTHPASIIAMTTRGRSAVTSALLGSVTAAALHDAGLPVFTRLP